MGRYDNLLEFSRLRDDGGGAVRGLVKSDPVLDAIRSHPNLMRYVPDHLAESVIAGEPDALVRLQQLPAGLSIPDSPRGTGSLRRPPSQLAGPGGGELFPDPPPRPAHVVPDGPSSWPEGMEPIAGESGDIFSSMRPDKPTHWLQSAPVQAAGGAGLAGLMTSGSSGESSTKPSSMLGVSDPVSILTNMGMSKERAKAVVRFPSYMTDREWNMIRQLPPQTQKIIFPR